MNNGMWARVAGWGRLEVLNGKGYTAQSVYPTKCNERPSDGENARYYGMGSVRKGKKDPPCPDPRIPVSCAQASPDPVR